MFVAKCSSAKILTHRFVLIRFSILVLIAKHKLEYPKVHFAALDLATILVNFIKLQYKLTMTDRVVLPSDVVPQHYELELTPNFDKLDFFCNQVIEVNVTNGNVTEITMHSKEIFIESAVFTSQSASTHDVTSINYNVKYHTVKLTFESALPAGAGKLTLKFRGILNGDMAGFYKSSYADANGNKKLMASTQFEALDARR